MIRAGERLTALRVRDRKTGPNFARIAVPGKTLAGEVPGRSRKAAAIVTLGNTPDLEPVVTVENAGARMPKKKGLGAMRSSPFTSGIRQYFLEPCARIVSALGWNRPP